MYLCSTVPVAIYWDLYAIYVFVKKGHQVSLVYMYIIFFCVVKKITIAIKVPKICKKMFPWMKKEDVEVQSTYIYLSQRFSLRRHLRGYLYILEC
jgi:hypothetical protein